MCRHIVTGLNCFSLRDRERHRHGHADTATDRQTDRQLKDRQTDGQTAYRNPQVVIRIGDQGGPQDKAFVEAASDETLGARSFSGCRLDRA